MHARIGCADKSPCRIRGLFQIGERITTARLEILVEQRDMLNAKLEEMKVTVQRLDGKIASYRTDGKCVETGDEWLRRG